MCIEFFIKDKSLSRLFAKNRFLRVGLEVKIHKLLNLRVYI